MNEAGMIAVIVASIAGCVAVESYVQRDNGKMLSPQQMCIKAAWTQADRMECLRASEPPTEKKERKDG